MGGEMDEVELIVDGVNKTFDHNDMLLLISAQRALNFSLEIRLQKSENEFTLLKAIIDTQMSENSIGRLKLYYRAKNNIEVIFMPLWSQEDKVDHKNSIVYVKNSLKN